MSSANQEKQNPYDIRVSGTLSQPLENEVNGFFSKCFGSLQQQDEHNDRYANKKDRIKYVLAVHEGKVIGGVIALKRLIQFKDRTISLGGIGGVCTEGRYRRQGIASKLLQAALNELKTAQCDIAYLCADIYSDSAKKLYGFVGFVPLSKPHTYLGVSGTRYFDTDGMIAPVNSPEIFREVINAKEPFDIGKGNW